MNICPQGYLHSLGALAEGLGTGRRHGRWGRERSAGVRCHVPGLRLQGGRGRCPGDSVQGHLLQQLRSCAQGRVSARGQVEEAGGDAHERPPASDYRELLNK